MRGRKMKATVKNEQAYGYFMTRINLDERFGDTLDPVFILSLL